MLWCDGDSVLPALAERLPAAASIRELDARLLEKMDGPVKTISDFARFHAFCSTVRQLVRESEPEAMNLLAMPDGDATNYVDRVVIEANANVLTEEDSQLGFLSADWAPNPIGELLSSLRLSFNP